MYVFAQTLSIIDWQASASIIGSTSLDNLPLYTSGAPGVSSANRYSSARGHFMADAGCILNRAHMQDVIGKHGVDARSYICGGRAFDALTESVSQIIYAIRRWRSRI